MNKPRCYWRGPVWLCLMFGMIFFGCGLAMLCDSMRSYDNRKLIVFVLCSLIAIVFIAAGASILRESKEADQRHSDDLRLATRFVTLRPMNRIIALEQLRHTDPDCAARVQEILRQYGFGDSTAEP